MISASSFSVRVTPAVWHRQLPGESQMALWRVYKIRSVAVPGHSNELTTDDFR